MVNSNENGRNMKKMNHSNMKFVSVWTGLTEKV